MKKITLYTDGACSGNPGVGGWAAILKYKNIEKELSGGEIATTNNIMELTAVIKGLEQLKEPCEVEVFSDSNYVVKAFLEGWIFGWIKNGWKTADNKEVKNVEIWQNLYRLTKTHKVNFNKVKGHSEDEKNNRCDSLARAEIKKLKKED